MDDILQTIHHREDTRRTVNDALVLTMALIAAWYFWIAFIAGSYSEHSALARLDFDLPQGSIVWQDSGFTDYEWEDFYLAQEQIEFAIQGKKNSLRGNSFIDVVAKKQNRKQVEGRISEITSRLGKKIHAVTIAGFQFKVFLLSLAFSIIKYINL